MKKLLFLTIFTLFITFSYSQENYSVVDSKVNLFPKKFSSIKNLALRINKDFNTDSDKVRALFYWVANNIAYDYEYLKRNNKNYKPIEKISDEYYEKELTKQKIKYANYCLKKGMAICEGYSQIIKNTLDILNIESESISGYAKKKAREIGIIKKRTNHAWNAVKINNKWFLLDVTWAAKNNSDHINENYYLILPKDLILSHFPKDEKWLLLDKPISKSEFFFAPIIHPNYYNSGVKINLKTKGLIKVKKDEIIKLTFDNVIEDDIYYFQFKNEEYSKPFKFIKENNKYIVKIPYTKSRNSELTLFHNGESILLFKILNAI